MGLLDFLRDEGFSVFFRALKSLSILCLVFLTLVFLVGDLHFGCVEVLGKAGLGIESSEGGGGIGGVSGGGPAGGSGGGAISPGTFGMLGVQVLGKVVNGLLDFLWVCHGLGGL